MIRRSVALLIWAVAALCFAIGCSDLGKVVKLAPLAQLSALSIDFGTIAVSQSATRSLTIHNIGTAPLAVTPALSGAAGYTLTSNSAPFTVEPGASGVINIQFSPSGVGPFSSRLALGPDAPQVALTATGALQNPGAVVVLSRPAINFGSVAVGQFAVDTFQVLSVGSAPAVINVVGVQLPPPNAANIQVTSGGGQATLAPGQSAVITLQFSPLASGQLSGSVQTGPGAPSLNVTGFGTTVSFSTQVNPIFTNYCSACHPWGDPNVAFSYSQLVNVASVGYGAHVRVKPFDLVNSVLYGKITNSGQYGALMPQGGPLIPVADRNLVKQWILEGATNN